MHHKWTVINRFNTKGVIRPPNWIFVPWYQRTKTGGAACAAGPLISASESPDLQVGVGQRHNAAHILHVRAFLCWKDVNVMVRPSTVADNDWNSQEK